MTDDQVQIAAPDPRRHREALIDLVAKTFPGGGGYWQARDRYRRKCSRRSNYDWVATRAALVDGRPVTHFGVWDYRMRIGSVEVRTGGIGNVATDGDYRKRGLMARTAEASLAALRELGYDMSILWAIPDFYHRFGYVRSWPDTTWTVRLGDLPRERARVKRRRITVPVGAEFDALYNRTHAGLTGTAVRPTYRCNHWDDVAGLRWDDRRGRLAGYVIFGQDRWRLRCPEGCGDPDEVLRVLAAEARRRRCTEVQFTDLHQRTGLARRIRRGPWRAESHQVSRGGPMVCIVSLAGTLARMAGELERRLAESAAGTWRGKLLLSSGRERATLAIDRGKVRVGPPEKTKHAIRGGDALAQLLIGTDEPDEVIAVAGMRISGEGRRLARALFPAQQPRLSSWDRF